MKKIIILASLFIIQIISIGVPLTIGKQRCMITYSIGDTQTIKLDMNFPAIADQTNDQMYMISWRNTQTNQAQFQKIANGPFKKQLELQLRNQQSFYCYLDIIYEVCFWFETRRSINKIVSVQYSASSLFDIRHQSIKVPDTLLKSQDLKQTFQNAEGIIGYIKYFKDVQQHRNKQNQRVFYENISLNNRMINISILQLVIIIAAGIYQFWALRGFLIDKRYV